jgi:hypothetical protein
LADRFEGAAGALTGVSTAMAPSSAVGSGSPSNESKSHTFRCGEAASVITAADRLCTRRTHDRAPQAIRLGALHEVSTRS